MRRSELPGEFERLLLRIHGHHLRARRDGNHHRRQAHAAATVHRHPFSRGNTSLVDHRAERGRKPTTQARRRHEVQIVRQPDQVRVGVRQGDQLGKRTPRGEPGLEVVVANVRLAGEALGTSSAPDREGHRHAVARLPAAHLRARGFDHPGQFMSGNVRQADVWVVAHPAVPVAPADAVGPDPHHHAVGRRCRIGHLAKSERSAELLVEDRPHAYIPCPPSCGLPGWNGPTGCP